MYKEVKKEELEQFPDYDGKPEHYVGSKDYWEGVFSMETNRDPELHQAFCELHEEIVNMVCRFCKEHNLTDVDEFSVHADGLIGSIEYEKWCSCTDSSMNLIKLADDVVPGYKGKLPDRDNPFLFEI